jgi:hypothetical protein
LLTYLLQLWAMLCQLNCSTLGNLKGSKDQRSGTEILQLIEDIGVFEQDVSNVTTVDVSAIYPTQRETGVFTQ